MVNEVNLYLTSKHFQIMFLKENKTVSKGDIYRKDLLKHPALCIVHQAIVLFTNK